MGSQVFGKNADGGYDPKQLLIGDAAGVEFAKKLLAWGDAGEKIINSNITGDIAKEKFLAGESPYFLTGPWNVPDVQKRELRWKHIAHGRCRTSDREPILVGLDPDRNGKASAPSIR
jgi:arabinogalactan oligomer/maltooligosaccharide transport system substrate-binding protein